MRHEIWQCLAKDLHFHGEFRRWRMDINHMLFITVPINIAIASTGLIPNSTNWFIIAAYSLYTFWGGIYLFMFALSHWPQPRIPPLIHVQMCQVKGECNGLSFSSAVSPAWRHMPAYDISISFRCFLLILKHSCQATIVNNMRQL